MSDILKCDWATQLGTSDFFNYWIQQAPGESGLADPAIALQALRGAIAGGGLSPAEVSHLRSQLAKTDAVDDGLERLIAGTYGDYGKQFLSRVRAMLQIGLAANALAGWKRHKPVPTEFGERFRAGALALSQAWQFGDPPAFIAANSPTRLDNLPRADHAAWLVRRQPGGDIVSNHAWLAAFRLLRFLLGDDAPPGRTPVPGKMLTVAAEKPINPDDECGFIVDLTVAALEEDGFGFYVDPVSTGAAVFDDEFREAAEIAWRLHEPALRGMATAADGQASVLRLGCVVPEGVTFLGGPSAGGLAFSAVRTAALKTTLDPLATATVAVCGTPGWQHVPYLKEEHVVLGPPVSGFRGKFEAAIADGLRYVIVHQDQKEEAAIGLRAIRHADPSRPVGLELRTAASFHELYDHLTFGIRCDAVLRRHAEYQCEAWKKLMPRPFVDPHFAAAAPMASAEADTSERPAREAGPGDESGRASRYEPLLSEEERETFRDQPFEEIRRLLELGERICVTEDAGAGKTIAARRIVQLVSSDEGCVALGRGPMLAVCFESSKKPWPNDVRQALETALVPHVRSDDGVTAMQVVAYAVVQRRVAVVIDGFDQVAGTTIQEIGGVRTITAESLLTAIWTFLESPEGKRCQTIVTSRAFAVKAESDQTRFPREEWRFATILPFDEEQQTLYFRKAGHLGASESVRDLFRGESHSEDLYEQIADLLAVPVNLSLVREILRDGGPGELKKLRTRGDFYADAYGKLLMRARNNPEKKISDETINGWEEMLAAAAFQMMVDGIWNYSVVRHSVVQGLLNRATRRIRSRRVDRDDWQLLMALAPLTDHAILDNPDNTSFPTLSWKHRGWMEYFAAVYLVQYAGEKAIKRAGQSANDPQWYWVYRFAIEMRIATFFDSRRKSAQHRLATLFGHLFALPAKGERPTDLMYRAYEMMQASKLPRTDAILAAYRSQFDAILFGMAPTAESVQHRMNESDNCLKRAKLAAELLEVADLQKRLKTRSSAGPPKYSLKVLNPDNPAYCRCSDADGNHAKPDADPDRLNFLMGGGPYDKESMPDEKWNDLQAWKKLAIDAFHMAACCVTRAQYRLFDEAREKTDEGWGLPKSQIAPDDDSPVTHVNWFDAFCFALWLGDGYGLPTEAQWEGAAWGGINRSTSAYRNAVVGVFPYDNSFTTNNINHYVICPPNGIPGSPQRTLPVRWNDQRAATFMAPLQGSIPDPYRPNGFGLWQMNGNVWEWCNNSYANYDSRDLGERLVAHSGSSIRVMRGGSWWSHAAFCRSAFRQVRSPKLQDQDVGFRIVRVADERNRQ